MTGRRRRKHKQLLNDLKENKGYWKLEEEHSTSLGGKLAVEAVAQWLRHYATNRQVAGSIPDGVIGIFQ